MKQNVSFACSNCRSNWQLIDNFCLHLSEPNRIETWRKRLVNRIVTTEPRCTVISVNRFTSTSYSPKAELKIIKYFLFSLCLLLLALSILSGSAVSKVCLLHYNAPRWETIYSNQSTSCLLVGPDDIFRLQ